MDPANGSQPQQSRLLMTWFTVPEFKSTLMSMLTPAQLTVFLTGIGYIMTDAERTRFMRLDRQIFKDTTVLEKLMKEGYSIVLVSTRLHRLRDLIRHRGGSINPLSATTAEEREDDVHMHKVIFGDSQSFSSDDVDPDHIEIANVWLIITIKDHLAKDNEGRTVIRHPDFRYIDDCNSTLWPADFRYPRGFSYQDISEECAKIFDLYEWFRGSGAERRVHCYEREVMGEYLEFLQDWEGNDTNTIYYMKLNEASPLIHEVRNDTRYGIADPDDKFYATLEYLPDNGDPRMFSKIPL